jgi:hypothetical protein
MLRCALVQVFHRGLQVMCALTLQAVQPCSLAPVTRLCCLGVPHRRDLDVARAQGDDVVLCAPPALRDGDRCGDSQKVPGCTHTRALHATVSCAQSAIAQHFQTVSDAHLVFATMVGREAVLVVEVIHCCLQVLRADNDVIYTWQRLLCGHIRG